MNIKEGTKGITGELRLMLARARDVWGLVPRRHKLALAGAAVIMYAPRGGN